MMNTADRSIALVDAALRRRFHFIPFSERRRCRRPSAAGSRTSSQTRPGWIHMVNGDLTQDLGGPDLQIGPSYHATQFTEAKVDRIWRYSIIRSSPISSTANKNASSGTTSPTCFGVSGHSAAPRTTAITLTRRLRLSDARIRHTFEYETERGATSRDSQTTFRCRWVGIIGWTR